LTESVVPLEGRHKTGHSPQDRERDSSTPRGESLMRKYLNAAVVLTASAAISFSMIYVIV
jgi:hypothetical protein